MKRLVMVMVALALVAAACGGGSSDAQSAADDCALGEVDGDLNFYNWTDYIAVGLGAEEAEVRDLVADFEAEFGVKVIHTEYSSNEAMLQQIDAGVAYDVVVPSDYMVTTMREADLLVELNSDAVPNMANISELFADPPYDPGNQFSAPYLWGTTGIGYKYGSIDDSNGVSWASIFDPEQAAQNAGSISLLNDTRETLGSALIYLGYSLNTTNEAEVDEAVQLIVDTKDKILAFNSTDYWTLLSSGEVDVAQGWSGDFFAEYYAISTYDDDGNVTYDGWDDFTYAIPIEGSAAWVDTVAIPTTAEHPCTAQAFINYLLDGENGAELSNYNYYASPNGAAQEFIWDEVLLDETINPPPDVMAKLEFFQDLGDFNNYYADAFLRAKG